MVFSELGNSQGSFSYITPSSDLDIDDATLGKLLTEAHRDNTDYRNPEVMSVSQSSLSVVFDRTGKPVGERDVDQSIGFGVTRNTYSAHSKFSENTPAEKVVDRTGKPVGENSSNAQIRTLLDEQRQMIIAECCEKICHHELQAARAEEERRILREELWRQEMDFREVHQQSLTEMEELRKFQSSTFDTLARRKLIEDQNTILELSGRVQELQNEVNCMNDSKDFQDAESVRSGNSHVTSQPMSFPAHPIPEGILRHSFVSPRRKEGPPCIWDTHGISGNIFANPHASSSAPYPQELNPWETTIEEPLHISTAEKSERPEQNQDLRCQSGPCKSPMTRKRERNSHRESEKLKTVLELYDLETHQKKLGPDYHRLKAMVKRSIEQDIRNKNFGNRNGNFEKNAVVKNQGTKQRVQRILGDCWQWETNGQCVKGNNCSFRHDMNKRGKSLP